MSKVFRPVCRKQLLTHRWQAVSPKVWAFPCLKYPETLASQKIKSWQVRVCGFRKARMEKKNRRSRNASSSLPVTRPCLDPAGHSGMRKDILGVLCVKPGPTLPPSCLLLWSHHRNALGHISPWKAGPSSNSSSMLLRQTELLLELLGGPSPCCHLCILSSYNSNWQLICLSNLINKDNSNWHVRRLMHPLQMHMRVHGSKCTCHARSDGVGLGQGEGLHFNWLGAVKPWRGGVSGRRREGPQLWSKTQGHKYSLSTYNAHCKAHFLLGVKTRGSSAPHDQKGGTEEASTILNTNTGYKNAAGTQRRCT